MSVKPAKSKTKKVQPEIVTALGRQEEWEDSPEATLRARRTSGGTGMMITGMTKLRPGSLNRSAAAAPQEPTATPRDSSLKYDNNK